VLEKKSAASKSGPQIMSQQTQAEPGSLFIRKNELKLLCLLCCKHGTLFMTCCLPLFFYGSCRRGTGDQTPEASEQVAASTAYAPQPATELAPSDVSSSLDQSAEASSSVHVSSNLPKSAETSNSRPATASSSSLLEPVQASESAPPVAVGGAAILAKLR
jgi:hypothetical protein